MAVSDATKVRVSLVGLVLVVVAGGFTLASPRVRVAWIARGLRSEKPEVREATRKRLLELGRPTIDSVLPELVASELVEHAAPGSTFVVAELATKAAFPYSEDRYVLSSADVFGLPLVSRRADRSRGDDRVGQRRILVATPLHDIDTGRLTFYWVTDDFALDSDMEHAIVEAVRARAGERSR